MRPVQRRLASDWRQSGWFGRPGGGRSMPWVIVRSIVRACRNVCRLTMKLADGRTREPLEGAQAADRQLARAETALGLRKNVAESCRGWLGHHFTPCLRNAVDLEDEPMPGVKFATAAQPNAGRECCRIYDLLTVTSEPHVLEHG